VLTLSIMTLNIRTLKKMIIYIMILSADTKHKALSIMTLNIMTLNKMIIYIMILSAETKQNGTQHTDIEH